MPNATLTPLEKSRCRRYLGYRDSSQTEYSKIEGAFVLLDFSGAEEVRRQLRILELVEEALIQEIGNIKVSSVGGNSASAVRLRGPEARRDLWIQGNQAARMIGTILGIRTIRVPFATGPTAGVAGRA